MPVNSGRVAVGTAATEIPETCVMPFSIQLHNDDSTDEVFIGGPDVTTTTGMQLNKLENLRLDLNPLDRVYAVSSKSVHNLSYVVFRKSC